jgi:uncharacterized protein YhdP
VDLRIGRLDLGGGRLTDARISATPLAAGWDLLVASRELKGRVGLPAAGADTPLDLALEWLDLRALLEPGSSAGRAPPPERRPDAAGGRLPRLDLRVADLRWGDSRLGRFRLDLRPDAGGIRVPRLEFDGAGDTRVRGDATWLDSPAGGRGRLSLDLTSADTGPLLGTLDYAAVLSPAQVEARLRLNWPGTFEAFSLGQAEGRIELDVGAGRLLEVEPGVGRVLGFLNLGELSRRLSLDFRDLYEQGFGFERITGRIAVGGGKAVLESFSIDGPASDIHVSGSTDLRTRTFDQVVTVEPSLGTSVALAGAVAGGPVVGAAVYLMHRVSGGAIDRLGSYQYRVTGPWATPELTRMGWEPFARDGPGDAAANGGGGEQGDGQSGAAGKPRQPPRATAAPAAKGRVDDNLFLE